MCPKWKISELWCPCCAPGLPVLWNALEEFHLDQRQNGVGPEPADGFELLELGFSKIWMYILTRKNSHSCWCNTNHSTIVPSALSTRISSELSAAMAVILRWASTVGEPVLGWKIYSLVSHQILLMNFTCHFFVRWQKQLWHTQKRSGW